MTATRVEGTKVERTCPRCRRHLYHRAELLQCDGKFKLVDGVDYDYKGDPMFEVQADNGWPGDAWASELEKHDG